MDNRWLRSLLGLLCVGLILLLAGLQVQQYVADQRLSERAERVARTESELYRLLSLQQDIETGQRGYALTGKREFLKPYLDARPATAASLAALRRELRDEPEAGEMLQRVERLVEQKLAFSAQVVALRERGDAEGAAQLIANGRGRVVMDAFRAAVRQLSEREKLEVGRLRDQSDKSRAQMQLLSGVVQLVLLLMLAGAFYAYIANLRRLRAVSAQAHDQSVRQAAIFEAAMDAMVVLDAEGNIERSNTAAERLFGVRSEAFAGQPVANLFAQRPKDATIKALLKRVAAVPSGSETRVQGFVGRRPDGTLFDAEVATSPVQLGDGLHFLLVIRDATERRRVERMKSEFVSTVSHELRTPLTSIAGSLGLVAGGAAGDLTPRAAKLIGIASTNSQRLVRLINDMLDIEKIESGSMTFDLRPLQLRPVVQEAIQANLGFAAQSGVEIALAHGSSDFSVTADKDRLIQVLTNLLSNAIKFAPPASAVRVTIAPGERLHRITVSDCGPGIPPEFHDRLFTRFAQADSSDTRSKGGTGLGLAIVKEIVDRTGGRIGFETSKKGTSFHVDLPVVAAPGASRCVLLVQVNAALSGEITRSLASRGIDAAVVRNREELAEVASRQSYAAILLGLEMPGEYASELVRLIRSHPALAATPILASAPGDETGQVSQSVALVNWLDGPPSPEDLAKGAELVGSRDVDRPIDVLHVEDDVDVLGVIASAFEGKAQVRAATDAEQARAALREAEPDLVILDLGLPGESGLDLLPELRRADGRPIPVVVYTARDEDPDIAARVAAMLTKSKVELDDLVGTVLRIIGERGAR